MLDYCKWREKVVLDALEITAIEGACCGQSNIHLSRFSKCLTSGWSKADAPKQLLMYHLFLDRGKNFPLQMS